MDGFKNIEIKNFRGIDHLKIDDFSRVNVFLGQNNSGKSTVLEALFLIAGMYNPDLPQIINAFRTRKAYSKFSDIKYLFRNLNLTNSPEITSEQFDDITRHLAIRLTHEYNGHTQITSPSMNVAYSDAIADVNLLEMDFDVTKENVTQHHQSRLVANQKGELIHSEMDASYKDLYGCSITSADLTIGNVTTELSELFKRKMKDVILQRLMLFDRRVNAIEILANDIFIGFEGIEELIPIGMAGDGLRRYLSIIANSANPANNIILIDEIDNGLHYSAYKKLWEALFALAVSTNKQIFVTTHSKETLLKLNEMMEEHLEYQDEMALYTLEQTKLKGHQAYRLPYEGLAEACKNNVEIRSVAL